MAVTAEGVAVQPAVKDAQVEKRQDTPHTAQRRAVKLTVALPSDAIEVIEALAAREGKTKTQILREAIALKKFIEEELSNENTHLLIERDGVAREIVFT